ncbi:MAG: hypothetical protein AAF587_10470 [Bacteroidota bacterium]
MDLQELIDIWQENDEQLDQQLSVNHKLLKEVSLNRVHSLLRTFKFEKVAEVAVNVFFSYFLVWFILNSESSFRFLLPAILLLFFGIGDVIWNVYQLSLMSRISYGAPILQAQRAIEQLKLNLIRERNLLYIVIPLFPIAFFSVVAKAWFDLDFLDIFGPWMMQFVGGSFVVAAIIVWFLKKFPDPNLEKAIHFLQEISQYDQEDSGHFT